MSNQSVNASPRGGLWVDIIPPNLKDSDPEPRHAKPRKFGDGEGEHVSPAMPLSIKGMEIVKADDGAEEGVFHGFASTFNNKDFQNDIILPGAFKTARAENTKLLWQHDPGSPIGVWEELSETDRGLEVKGRLILEVPDGLKAFHLLKHKALDALSVGFRIANPKRDQDFDEETGIRRIKSVDLWEVSIVTFPANPKARISRVKDALVEDGTPDIRDLECALRDVGFTQSQAKRFLAEGYEGLVRRDVPEPELEDIGTRLRRFDEIINR